MSSFKFIRTTAPSVVSLLKWNVSFLFKTAALYLYNMRGWSMMRDSHLWCAVYSLASLINLLGVFRCGCCICGCKRRRQHGFSLTGQQLSRFLCFIETVFLFVPEWAYEFIESPHAWGAAAPLSDCSWSPVIKDKLLRFPRNISERCQPFSIFPTYLDQAGQWTGQNKSFPALTDLKQQLDSHHHPGY